MQNEDINCVNNTPHQTNCVRLTPPQGGSDGVGGNYEQSSCSFGSPSRGSDGVGGNYEQSSCSFGSPSRGERLWADDRRNHEDINIMDDGEMEVVKKALLKVFNNDDGRIVLRYYKTLFKKTKSLVDFNNSNKTYFNLGRLNCIETIEAHLEHLLTKGNDNGKGNRNK